ncbi:MAG TPA: type 1 glutamine amidotransferase [Candidatus Eisenbacteria bacterium]|nr:type 1 glutamine amidotransferase [Candidatus Eisenbacteria bacterium]
MASDRRPSVLAIQHVEPETTGLLGEALAEGGAQLTTVRVFAGEPVPADIAPHDALVVMGGPMGVYEADQHPHLADEVELIRRAVENEVPVLGVCLGSQLLAAALGSSVRPAHKELGWLPVTLTLEGTADPLFAGLPRTLTVFHWHGDAFDPPPRSVALASSDLTPCQAFRHGAHVGLLFHMEMSESMIRALVEQDLASGYADALTARRALEEMQGRLPAMRAFARKVFGRVSDAIAGKPLRA